MPAPTFLCIGAQKCGTTWLAEMVRRHPQVATGTRKELHFFNHEAAYARGLDWYEAQFPASPGARAIGEFTPNYWWTTGVGSGDHTLGSAERIAAAYPDLRLVLCLRDPVDRAVSAYFHNMQAGRIAPTTSLRTAIGERPGLREFSRYATQLDAWLRHYPLERFAVLVYEEDIRPDEAKPGALRRVFTHLDVDPDFVPRTLTGRVNVRADHFEMRRRHAHGWRRAAMDRMPERIRRSPRWTITIDDAQLHQLREELTPEILALEDRLGRRLPWARAT
ncbi:sulfotransferase [Nocardioides sp. R-C-SC26]|uniref:sulfotransferase family protein n=1 Tax=Nocardioides sp. R-C-SC26 TaxID=2870414 RepID=UPI001E494EE6|nr:sulfotransferase [Nocardioides sp. R-C-SC26]